MLQRMTLICPVQSILAGRIGGRVNVRATLFSGLIWASSKRYRYADYCLCHSFIICQDHPTEGHVELKSRDDA